MHRNRKIIRMMIFTLCCFFIVIGCVNAEVGTLNTCPLGKKVTEDLKGVFTIIKILGPVLVIGLSSLEFIKALTKGEIESESKKISIKAVKRLVFAVTLFMLPVLIEQFGIILGIWEKGMMCTFSNYYTGEGQDDGGEIPEPYKPIETEESICPEIKLRSKCTYDLAGRKCEWRSNKCYYFEDTSGQKSCKDYNGNNCPSQAENGERCEKAGTHCVNEKEPVYCSYYSWADCPTGEGQKLRGSAEQCERKDSKCVKKGSVFDCANFKSQEECESAKYSGGTLACKWNKGSVQQSGPGSYEAYCSKKTDPKDCSKIYKDTKICPTSDDNGETCYQHKCDFKGFTGDKSCSNTPKHSCNDLDVYECQDGLTDDYDNSCRVHYKSSPDNDTNAGQCTTSEQDTMCYDYSYYGKKYNKLKTQADFETACEGLGGGGQCVFEYDRCVPVSERGSFCNGRDEAQCSGALINIKTTGNSGTAVCAWNWGQCNRIEITFNGLTYPNAQICSRIGTDMKACQAVPNNCTWNNDSVSCDPK